MTAHPVLARPPSRRGRRVVVAMVAVVVSSALVGVGPASARSGTSSRAAQAVDEVTPEVAEQIEAIAEEKASRTPAERKVDSNLIYAVNEEATGEAVDGAPELKSTVEVSPQDQVSVDIDADVTPGLLAAIESAGGEVVASVPDLGAVRAMVPVDAVLDLAARSQVTGIRPADVAVTNRADGPAAPGSAAGPVPAADEATAASVGAAINEADVSHGGPAARSNFGVDGTGVKVCVLSDGVNTIAARQASGDLPAVDVLPGQAGSGDEGTAMLELIHDIAPGAELGFATAFTSLASFAANITALRADGCDVIVDDVSYFSEPTFQDGAIAQAITAARADGAIYFSSAGNSGNLPDGTSGTWQGDFQDIGLGTSPLPTTKRVHGWGQGTAYNTITKTGGPINLQWADPAGGSANDYDLYLINSAGTAVTSSSTNLQSGAQDPHEQVATSPVGAKVAVVKAAGAADRYLAVYTNRGGLTYGTGGSSRGHNVSVDAISVAATPSRTALGAGHPTGPYPGLFSASSLTEKFTSDGPTRQFFTPAGAAITPGNFSSTGGVTRNGIDITAGDGAATTTPGFIPFFGTSAAAPNAAAIAALALDGKPSLTTPQLEAALDASAIDIETAGTDPVAGAGIIMAPQLMTTIGLTAKGNLTAGARTISPTTGDGDGSLEPGESATLAQAITNVSSASATGATATLVSNSPNATVTQATRAYGTIAGGATSNGTGAALAFSVAAGCPCGAALPFTLTVTYGNGVQPTLVIPISVPTGAPAAPTTSTFTGSVAIPDGGTTGASSPFVPVGSIGTLRDLSVTIGGSSCNTTQGSSTVGIDHSYVGDLTISLRSPAGTTVKLMERVGGSGNNLCGTVFSDDAATSIQSVVAASAPFTGTYQPVESLSAFDGENPQGSWTLIVADGATSDTGTIRTFSVTATGSSCDQANTPPTGVADGYGTGQGVTLSIGAPGVLANDSDPAGDDISASLQTGASHGTVTLDLDGSFDYLPLNTFHGTDSFTYTPTDGKPGGTGNATIVTITVNGTPIAGADSYATGRNTTLTRAAPGVLGNDADPESNPMTAALAVGPAHGTLTFNPNGSFSFVPTTGYSGPDAFTYTVTDGTTTSEPQTVTLQVNAPPAATNDSYGVVAGSTLTVAAPGVLANDTDAEGDALTTVLAAGPSHGTLTLNANGSFSYTPTGAYFGPDAFTYRAKDATGQSGLATVNLTVSASNTAPTAVADSYSTPRNTALNVAAPGVLGNDTDAQGTTLTAVLVAGPANGTLTLNPNGSFGFVPTTGFSGTATFTYKASDGSLQSATQTVSIKVNAPPAGFSDSYTTPFNTLLTIGSPGVLGNDTDAEGDALTAVLGAGPAHGTLTLNANGSFTYGPTGGYVGPDSFTYRAKDATGQSGLATVSLTVQSGNQAPVAVGDSYRVVRGRQLHPADSLLINDTDPEDDLLTATLVGGPAHGTVSIDAEGYFVYTPASGYTGMDSFTYRVSDGTSQSAPATVSIEVLTPTAAYVAAVYQDFLTRVADAGGMAYWGGRLDRGVETRTSFVLKMSRSHEYGVKVVRRAFQSVLQREVDPSGREYWANKVQKGMPISDLTLNLISSNEYLTKSGGTVEGFVNRTYIAILNRSPSAAERTAKVNAINGGTTRLRFASDLYKSTESRQRRVKIQYTDLLDRQPTAAELGAGVTLLATRSDIDLAIQLGAGTEYYTASQTPR